MKNIFRNSLLVSSTIVLVSCGGGGGDSGSTVAPSNYWTMDAFTYVDGGTSSQSTASIGGNQTTVAVVSTATLAGGDTSNGAYSGSTLSFSFAGTSGGTYNVVPTAAAFISADPSTNPILVTSNVGVAVTSGSTEYTAASGQVTVALDASSKFHFSAVGPVTMTKTLDVLGGVTGAPASMVLAIYDAY